MNIIDLAGNWKMKDLTDAKEYDAAIPGTDFGAMIKSGAIANPLISGDDNEGIRTAEHDVEFSRTFTVSEDDLKQKHAYLNAGGLDTLCDCFINGEKAFESRNAFIPVNYDIKGFLTKGENSIVLRFYSAVKYIKNMQKQNPLPKNSNGVDGIPYIRKPACHFGWDWGPCVPYCGVLKNIEIKFINRQIENITITQQTSREKSVVTANADNADKIYIIYPDSTKAEPESGGKFTINDPKLWYTYEMAPLKKQPLYTVVFENDEEKVERKIGLRSLYLDRGDDEYGSNFCFVLNGEKVFAKGANLIPFSALYEDSDNSTADYYLDLARKSNFNMLRIWGGGSYADDYLISRCDEMGILVWQDFCFACQMYPFYDDSFTSGVLNEVSQNVKRLTTHPSLALWCGNNELETMFSYLPKNTKIVKAYEKFFYHTLPDFIKDLTDASYIPTSPIGSACFKEYSADNVGDTHMWNVWHGLKKLDYYTKRYSRFLSEFGLESLPSMKAIKTFAPADEYSITSPSFNRHQKCVGGNRKMMFYLTEMFDLPKHFEDLPYLTGIVQAECIKNATIHFRQNKGRCNGSLFWQFNDVWNCPSWSSVDFEGIPKALQYKAREFFDPITVSCKKEKGRAVIFAHNDTLKKADMNIKLTLLNPSVSKDVSVSLPPNSCKKVCDIKVNKNSVLRINFNGKSITEIFDSPSKLRLKKAVIKTKLDGGKLTLSSDNFAYDICIESDALPDENYFCLMPGEVKTVSFNKAPNKIKVKCANNIEFKRSKLKKALFRFFYRLEPMNIANYFYYTYN